MRDRRSVKLYRSGDHQTVRIPAGFELPGTEALMHRDGPRLIIEPARKRGLAALLAELEPVEHIWPTIADPAPDLEPVF